MSLDPAEISNIALQANAPSIGLADATSTYQNARKSSYVADAYIEPAAYDYIRARTNGTIINKPEKVAVGSHGAATQCRKWMVDEIHNRFFEYDAALRRWDVKKSHQRVRFLIIGAADHELYRYKDIRNVSFYVANFEARDRGRFSRVLLEGNAAPGGFKEKLLSGCAALGIVPGRVYYQDLPNEGEHFDLLLCYDSAYNIDAAQWALWFHRTRAVGAFCSLIMPPELMFPDMPPCPYYTLRTVSNPRVMKGLAGDVVTPAGALFSGYTAARDAVKALLFGTGVEISAIPVRDGVPPLATPGHKRFVHVYFHTASRTVVGGPGAALSLEALAQIVGEPDGDALRRKLAPLDDWLQQMCDVYNTVAKPRLFDIVSGKLRSIEHSFGAWVSESLGADAFSLYEDVSLNWLQAKGGFDHGYYHNKATWKAYYAPGWVVPPVTVYDDDGVRRVVAPQTQIVVETLKKAWLSTVLYMYPTTKCGRLSVLHALPEADHYVKVLNLHRSTRYWRKGVGKFVYDSVHTSLLFPFLSYVSAVTQTQLDGVDIMAQLITWLRRQLNTPPVISGHPTTSLDFSPMDYAPLALSCLCYVREVRDRICVLLDVFRKRSAAGRFGQWLLGLFDDTIVERLVNWLGDDGLRGKYLISGDKVVIEEVEFAGFEEDRVGLSGALIPVPPSGGPPAPSQPVSAALAVNPAAGQVAPPSMVQAVANALQGATFVEAISDDKDCPVCKARDYNPSKVPFAKCKHNPATIDIACTMTSILDWISELRDDTEDKGVSLTELKRKAADAIRNTVPLDQHELRVKAEVRLVIGPPGTGKSVLGRDIASLTLQQGAARGVYDPFLIVSPMRAVGDDFDNAWDSQRRIRLKMIKDGQAGAGNFYFKTTHYALCMPPMPVSGVIVEECGAVDFRLVAILAHRFKAPIYLIGDPNQTTLVGGKEGVPLFESFATIGYQPDDFNVHSLVKNFRNPENCIPLLNLNTADPMLPASGRHYAILVHHVDKEPNWIYNLPTLPPEAPTQWKHIMFTKATAKLVWPDLGENERPKAYTVRSNQGKTYDNVALHISSMDVVSVNGSKGPRLAYEKPQLLVAFSRHKYRLVVVVHGDYKAVDAWMKPLGINNVHHSNLNDTYVAPNHLLVQDAPPPEETKELTLKYAPPCNSSIVEPTVRPEALGIENDVDDLKTAARNAPLTGKYNKVLFGPDARHDLTQGGVPRSDFAEPVVRISAPVTIAPQMAEQREAQRSIIARQAATRKQKEMSEATKSYVRHKLGVFAQLFVQRPSGDFEDLLLKHVAEWYRDACDRNYFGRFDGQNVDVGLGLWDEAYAGRFRASMKMQVKVPNVQKKATIAEIWAKAGQALVAADVPEVIRDGILVRFLTEALLSCFKTEGYYRVVLNYKCTERQFEEKLQDAVSGVFGNSNVSSISGDVKEADMSQTQGDIALFAMMVGIILDGLQLFSTPVEAQVWIDRIMKMCEGAIGRKVDGPEIKFETDAKVQSGQTWTYVRTTLVVLGHVLLYFLNVDNPQPMVITVSGDDSDVIAQKLPTDNELWVARARIEAFSNMVIEMTRNPPGEGTEFCGRLIHLGRGKVEVMPFLHRRYMRVLALQTPEKNAVEYIAEYQKSIRTWLRDARMRGAERVIVVNAAKLESMQRKTPTWLRSAQGLDFHDAYTQSRAEWDYLDSFSKTSVQEILDNMSRVTYNRCL